KDVTSYTIPNWISLALIAAFAAVALVSGASLATLGLCLASGFVALLVGMGMFAAGWVGGGDAKLFAAVSLWLGLDAIFDYALMASILGGAPALGLLALRQLPLPVFLVKQPWFARLSDHKGDV